MHAKKVDVCLSILAKTVYEKDSSCTDFNDSCKICARRGPLALNRFQRFLQNMCTTWHCTDLDDSCKICHAELRIVRRFLHKCTPSTILARSVHAVLHIFQRRLTNQCTPRRSTHFVDSFKICVRHGAAQVSMILEISVHDMEQHRLRRFLQNLGTIWSRTDLDDSCKICACNGAAQNSTIFEICARHDAA